MTDIQINENTVLDEEMLKSFETLVDEALDFMGEMKEDASLAKTNELEAVNAHVEGNLQPQPNGEMPAVSGQGQVSGVSIKPEKDLGKKADEATSDTGESSDDVIVAKGDKDKMDYKDDDMKDDDDKDKGDKDKGDKDKDKEDAKKSDSPISDTDVLAELVQKMSDYFASKKEAEKVEKSLTDIDRNRLVTEKLVKSTDVLREDTDKRFSGIVDTLSELTEGLKGLRKSVDVIASQPVISRKSIGVLPSETLAKSNVDVEETPLNKNDVLNKLLDLQKNGEDVNSLIQRVSVESNPDVIRTLISGVLTEA